MSKYTTLHPISGNKRHYVIFIILFFIASCTGLDHKKMVPEVNQTSATLGTGMSIKKIHIRGEKEEVFGGAAYAKKDQILQAARTTLRQSGLFKSVDEGQGKLDLHIVVRSQGQDVSLFLEYRANLTITYRFIDDNNELVWTKSYESEFSSHAFSGATRTVEAREGSVRENLASLVDGIKSTWPKH